MKFKMSLFLILFCLSILLVGCNQTKKTSEIEGSSEFTTTYREEINLSDIYQNMEKQLKFRMKMNMQMTINSTSITLNMETLADFANETNGKMEMHVVVSTLVNGRSTFEETQSYLEFTENEVVTYAKFLDTWSKTVVNLAEYKENEADFNDVIVNNLDIIKSGTDKLADQTSVDIYQITIEAKDIINSLLSEDITTALGIDSSEIEHFRNNLQVNVYIDPVAKLIRKMDFDLKDFFSQLLSTNINKAFYTLEFSDYDNVDVVIPKSVLNNHIETVNASEKQINLDFKVKDSAVHTNEPIIYLLSSSDKKLYAVNYETQEIKTITLTLEPQCLYYRDGYVYIALLKHQSTPYIREEQQEGSLVIVNAATFKIENQFDVELDPFDMVVDSQGYIYITSGSGQSFAPFDSYNNIGLRISRTYIDAKSYAYINEHNSKIYTVDTRISPRDMTSYDYLTGRFVGYKELKYHGDYRLNTNISISPDGKYIFNGSGNIFTCAPLTEDMLYYKTLPFMYNDITYDLNTNKIYTAFKNMIVSYDENLSLNKIYNTKLNTDHLFFNLNQLIAVGDNYIVVIDENKPKEKTPIVNIPPKASDYDDFRDVVFHNYESEIVNLPFAFTKLTYHPTEPIIFATNKETKTVYLFNYETQDLQQLGFNLPVESLYYRKGELYVTLLKGEHSSFWFNNQSGEIAVINIESMMVTNRFTIDMDPYDIVVDNDGYIYVSGGSGQHTAVRSYNAIGMNVDAANIYQQSLLKYDFVNNILYGLDNSNYRYTLKDGHFTESRVTVSKNIAFAPNGLIYTKEGNILDVSLNVSAKLEFKYDAIAFDEVNNHYYTARKNNLLMYDYTTNKLLGLSKVTGNIVELRNNHNQLIALEVDGNGKYFLEIIKVNLQDTANVDDFALDNQEKITLVKYNRDTIFFDTPITDALLHPTKPLLYLTSGVERKMYGYNYLTKEVIEIQFNYPISKIKFINNNLFVSLERGANSEIKSTIAKLDDNFNIMSEINFSISLNDFGIDSNGYIYTLSKIGNTNFLTGFDQSGNKVDEKTLDSSLKLNMNIEQDKIYGVQNYKTQYNIYYLHNGNIDYEYINCGNDYTYNVFISPNGQFLINNSGLIFDLNNDFNKIDKILYNFEFLNFTNENLYALNYTGQLFVYDSDNFVLKEYSDFNTKESIRYFFNQDNHIIYITNYEYNSYKINVLSKTTGEVTINEPIKEIKEPTLIKFEGETKEIAFLVTNVIKDPNAPILYLVSSADMKLYAYNYETQKYRELKLNLVPENLYYSDGKIYLTLLKGQHDSFWFNDQKGAIAIIDTETMTLINQFDITIDPANIAVDNDGYIYVTGGSGQGTNAISYDPLTFEPIDQIKVYAGANVLFNNTLNKLYVGETSLSTYFLNKGQFIKDKTVSSDNKEIFISPDGKFLFNKLGFVYYLSIGKDDLLIKTKLVSGFNSITFDLENDLFYIANNKTIYQYQYSTLSLIGYANEELLISYLFKDNEQFISINRGPLNNYLIKLFNFEGSIDNNPPVTEVPQTETVYYHEDSLILDHTVTASIMDETEPIIYITSATNKMLYAYNFMTKEVKTLSFPKPFLNNMTIRDNKLYLILENTPPYTTEVAYYATVDLGTFTIEKIIPLDFKPFDITVDHNGNIYFTQYRLVNEDIYLRSYSPEGTLIDKKLNGQKNYLAMHPFLNRLYVMESGLSSLGLKVFQIEAGNFGTAYEIGNHREPYFVISPDGRYYFHKSGKIEYISLIRKEDGMSRYILPSFTTIAFELANNKFFIAKGNNIYQYDYTNYNKLETTNINGEIQNLYNYNGQLVALTKGENGTYQIKVLTKSSTPYQPPIVDEIKTLNFAETEIALKSSFTNMIKHPTEPILYYVNSDLQKLYSLNYLTNETNSLSFSLTPEQLIYHEGKLYISLLRRPHSFSWFIEDQSGVIAIIDAQSLTKIAEKEVKIDPYDLDIIGNYLFITSGSGQWSELQSYDLTTFTKVASLKLYQGSVIEANQAINKVYYNDYNLGRFYTENGMIYNYGVIYHNNSSEKQFIISPDGKYLFNSLGAVFICSEGSLEDLMFKTQIQGFKDITFDLTSNHFYTASEGQIMKYNYRDFTLVGKKEINRPIKKLFNDGNKLVVVYGNYIQILIEK